MFLCFFKIWTKRPLTWTELISELPHAGRCWAEDVLHMSCGQLVNDTCSGIFPSSRFLNKIPGDSKAGLCPSPRRNTFHLWERSSHWTTSFFNSGKWDETGSQTADSWGLYLWPENCNVLSFGVVFSHLMPFMQPPCETCRGLRRVRSALQESDPLIYRVLIRLPLWRCDQAKDEISPSFCVCVSFFCEPPQRNPASLLYPSLAPFITTPCTRVMMQFVGTRALALHWTGAPPQGSFFKAQSSLQTRLQLNGEFALCILHF